MDETKSRSLILAARIVPDAKAREIRSLLRTHLLKGQRAIHFAKESDRRRRQIFGEVLDLEIETHIFDSGLKPQGSSRSMTLHKLTDNLAPTRLCLELDLSSLKNDQLVLSSYQRRADSNGLEFNYSFEIPSREPLLWLPDIFAWVYQRRGSDLEIGDASRLHIHRLDRS